MNGRRFRYHAAAVGTGMAFGGPAGAIAGFGTRVAEFAYDTSKSTLETVTGQWGSIVNSINSAIMQSR